ncbi:hypothetical protein [Lysobacter gummosus]
MVTFDRPDPLATSASLSFPPVATTSARKTWAGIRAISIKSEIRTVDI